MKILLRISGIAAVCALSACSTPQLYEGPRLPASQTAKVRGKSLEIDGKGWNQFWSREAEISAGIHRVACKTVFYDKAVSCSKTSSFNYSAQSECEKTRDNEAKKYGSGITDCRSCKFEELKQTCQVPTYYVFCDEKVSFQPQTVSEVECSRDRDLQSAYDDTLHSASMYINHKVIRREDGSSACRVTGPVIEPVIDSCDSCAVVNQCIKR